MYTTKEMRATRTATRTAGTVRDGQAGQTARETGHGAVVVMAANGKDDPAEAPRLIEALESGYDYVQGSRYLASGGASINLPLGRSVMIRGYTLLFRLLSGFRVSDVTN